MVAQHRALALLIRHSKTLIRPSCKGVESFWILRILSDQVGLSVISRTAHVLTTRACEAMRYWGFERWSNQAYLLVCFRLSVQLVRCYSHLARSYEVFHNWGGKTCGTLIDWSHDARPESGDTTGVVTSIGVRKCNRGQDIQPESYLSTRVGHTIGVVMYLHYKHV
jgi:hypothetical protein